MVKKKKKKSSSDDSLGSLVALSFKSAIFSIIGFLLLTSIKEEANLKVIAEDVFTKELTIEQQEDMIEVVEKIIGEDIDNYNLAALYGVYENDKLNEYEKALAYNLDDLINENHYVDLNRMYKSLKNLDIVYIAKDDKYDEKVQGVYLYQEDLIKIFSTEDEADRKTMIHELIHSIFFNSKTAGVPNFIEEGMTHLLTNEYFSTKPYIEENSYPFEIAVVKMLCEMTSPDAVLKAYTTGNDSDMKSYLINSMGTIETYQFFNKAEKLFDDFENGKEINQEDFKFVTSYISEYFMKNYSNDESKMEFFEYHMNMLLLMKSEEPYIENYLYIRDKGVYEKAHFSERLKEKNPTGNITLYNSDLDCSSIANYSTQLSDNAYTYYKNNSYYKVGI